MKTSGKAVLTKWDGGQPPSVSEIEQLFRTEGLSPSRWSNGPGDRYRVHDHSYHKVLYCANGSIEFISGSESFELFPGDRLDIPPGTPHSAIVGDRGVTCLEAGS
jgi:quercetin dioxygenase-like cupin family protein